MRVVDIVAPFAPRWPVHGEFVLSNPRGYMSTGDLCRMPLAAISHGSARKSSGTGPCGDCRRVLWGTRPAGSVFGKNLFHRESWGTSRGGRHVAKRSSGHRVAYPVQVRDLVRVVGTVVPLFPKGGRYSGSIRFTEPQVVKGHMRLVSGAPSSGALRESQAIFRDGTVWGL